VGARLAAFRAGQPLGDPILPLNLNAVITATASPDRGKLDDSFLFQLDPAWISGTVQLRAELNSEQLVAETGYDDNIFTATVTFEPSPPLTVTLVGVIYAESNITYTADTTDYDRIASWLQVAYPTGRLTVITRTLTITGGLPTASDLNQRLATIYSLDAGNTDNCPGMRIYGLVDDGEAAHFMRGRAIDIPGCIASGPTGEHDWGWDDDGSYGDWYAAHELGHTLGRYHTEGIQPPPCGGSCSTYACRGTCGCEGGANVVYPDGRIGGPAGDDRRYYGFDIQTRAIYTPTGWVDVMTYCDYQWISDVTYQGIYDRLITETVGTAVAQSVPAPAGEHLLVLGEMNLTQGTAELGTLYRLPDLTSSGHPSPSSYTLRLLDAGDALLAEYPFTPRKDTEHYPGEDLKATVYEIIPYAAGTARVVVTGEGGEITSRMVSPNPPTVTMAHPNGGEQLGPRAVATWSGSDPDGGTLTYALLYSADDGATWTAFASGIQDTHYTLHTGELPGSGAARIRVLASDGVNTAWDDSDGAFRVPFKAPVARIFSPGTGESYLDEQTIILVGEAYDREDGPLGAPSLLWLSSLDGALGSGRSIAVTGLSVGEHSITLQATDRDRMTGTARITLHMRTKPRVYLPLVLKATW
jgi:hypothetical protein